MLFWTSKKDSASRPDAVIPMDSVQPVEPGSALVDGRRIPEYTNTLKHERLAAGKAPEFLGTWSDRVEIRSKPDGETLFRTQRADTTQTEAWFQEIEVRRRTLEPISVVIHSGSRLHNRVLHNGRTIHTTREMWPEGDQTGGAVNVDLVITAPCCVFEWQLWELTFAAFPLEIGLAGRFLAHHVQIAPSSPLIRVTFFVVGEDIVTTDDGLKIDCWRLRVKADNDWTVWIAKDPSLAPVVQANIDYGDYVDRWLRTAPEEPE